jgi:hypothetical protein
MIRDIKDLSDYAKRHGYKQWLARIYHKRGWGITIPWNKPKGSVQAHIIEGKWMAYCPDPDCMGAMAVSLDEPIMFCVDCANVKNDHHPFNLEIKHREVLEDLMARRVDPRTRNYLRGESVMGLMLEQIHKGELTGDEMESLREKHGI